ncbi:MAG: molybdate ABC transporter substrate-binding protein [Anaerolineae bacterium]
MAVLLAGCGPPPEGELTVSAAISLSDAFGHMAAEFEKTHPGVTVRLNYASSGSLAAQIAHGAPADVFASAGQAQMDALEAQDLLLPGTRQEFAANELVLIVPRDSSLQIAGFADLARLPVTRLAMGNPETVPAGQYAQQALMNIGLWQEVQGKLVLAENVRQVLAYVEQDEVEAGLVYATDAAMGRAVRVVATAPSGSHPPIRYPIAVLANSQHKELALEFIAFVRGQHGRAILRQYGFTPLGGEMP